MLHDYEFIQVLLDELKQVELRRQGPPAAVAPETARQAEVETEAEAEAEAEARRTSAQALQGIVEEYEVVLEDAKQKARMAVERKRTELSSDTTLTKEHKEERLRQVEDHELHKAEEWLRLRHADLAKLGDWARERARQRREREQKLRDDKHKAYENDRNERAKTEQAYADARKEDSRRRKCAREGGSRWAGARGAPGGAEQALLDKLLSDARHHANSMDLSGLALSGGGIRSATFCLGVLQGLARLGLLRRLDYLSTVSGGGYIGSWLAAWVKREGSLLTVEKQLRSKRVEQAEGRTSASSLQPVEEEPEPIFHLRSYSNYLAPRLGVASADSWVLLAIYLRNLLLNQAVLLPAVVAVLLVPRLVFYFYDWELGGAGLARVFLGIVAFSLMWACWHIIGAISRIRQEPTARLDGGDIETDLHGLHLHVLLPVLLASLLYPWVAWVDSKHWLPPGPLAYLLQDQLPERGYLVSAFRFGELAALGFGLLHIGFYLFRGVPNARGAAVWRLLRWMWTGLISGFICGVLLGLLHCFGLQNFHTGQYADLAEQAQEVALVTALWPAAFLLLCVLGVIIHVGMLGWVLGEAEREWWASLSGWVMLYAACWAALALLSLFSVPLLYWAGPTTQAVLGSSWLLAVLGGLRAAHSPRTGSGPRNVPLDVLARAAPYVFVAGLLVLLAWLVSAVGDNRPTIEAAHLAVAPRRVPPEPVTEVEWKRAGSAPGVSAQRTETHRFTEQVDHWGIARYQYWAGLLNAETESRQQSLLAANLILAPNPLARPALALARPKLATDDGWLLLKWSIVCAACGGAASVAAWFVGVNTFSLHGLYANRLIRCYLGASRPKREMQTDQLHGAPTNTGLPPRVPNPITGFDPRDDFPLCALEIRPYQETLPDRAIERRYRGPYVLINAALNLTQGDELAWQERKAESFLFSPLYCGSKSTGYRNSQDYAGGVTVGTAVTVSGAAASPNMGYHSSPPVTALLTVFNVRLGVWFGNPHRDHWKDAEPWSLGLLFKELFGRTNRRSRFVYLSDGGHFENLGVYELVRRQCRYIIAVDGDEDPGYQFYDLGSLIRKCRSDLGVPIEIDVTPIKKQAAGDYSQWHCAIGTIRYDAVDPQAVPGFLLYIKASLTGNEPTDVLNYAVEHPPFPHQSTGNQFFKESQFESYRALGEHVAEEVLGAALRIGEQTEECSDMAHRLVLRRLFANLQRRWFPPLPQLEASFLESTEAFARLQGELRDAANLGGLSHSLYPELGQPVPGAADPRRAEIHTVSEMLQVMENAWLGVHLEGYHAHPLNRGWMNVFRRWTSAPRFREYWPILRGEYSEDFVRFCESEFRLGAPRPEVYEIDKTRALFATALHQLEHEFLQEWPGQISLHQLAHGASFLRGWLIAVPPPSDKEPQTWTTSKHPCGALLVYQNTEQADAYELLIWLRGPYRSLGIGRDCLERLFPDIVRGLKKEGKQSVLRVRYPLAGRPLTAERIQKELWQTFFFQYGFRPDPSPATVSRAAIVLRVDI